MGLLPDPEPDARRIDGVYEEHLTRIMKVMREHYPKVLAANRFFEEETGIHNELGANNLNDSLSHLGTLFEKAAEMSRERQGEEVHDFEGHLRRGMMESYEQVFRIRMGEVDELWAKHERTARPLQLEDKLHGVPSLDSLDVSRRRCKSLLDKGRAAKRGHDWDAWDEGTEALAEACRHASALAAALDQGVAGAEESVRSANRDRTDTRRFRLALAFAVVALPLGFFINQWSSGSSSVKVPHVVGVRVPSAVIILADAAPRVTVSPRGATGSGCRVIAESPPAGATPAAGTRIVLTVSCP